MPLGASRLTLLAFQPAVAAAAEVIRQRLGVSALNGAHTSADQKMFGGTSLELDGTDDRLICGDGTETQFQFGANDFTVEGWIRPTVINTSGSPIEPMWNKYNAGNSQRMLTFGIYDGKLGYFWASNGSSGNVVQTSQTISVNTWQHIALCREGNTWNTYYNGTRVDTRTISNTLHNSTDPIYIGSYFGASGNEFRGYIDEVRVSKVARYTGTSFVVPALPFGNDEDTLQLLHMDGTDGGTFFEDDNGEFGRHPASVVLNGNVQVDTAQSVIGSSSILFDGTDDYLTCTPQTLPSFGDFTVEMFIRLGSSPSGNRAIWWTLDNDGTNRGGLYMNSSGNLTWWNASDNVNYLGTLATGNNYHIACVQDGGTRRLFVDGVEAASASSTHPRGELLEFGAANYTSTAVGDWNGHMDEIRVSNVARYTADFTVPTEAFVNDKNTTLLLHGEGVDASLSILDDSGNRPAVGLQPVGDTHISTDQSKFGNSSIEFDGTGDYLNIPAYANSVQEDNSIMELRGDYTIEAWCRVDSVGSSQSNTIMGSDDTSPYNALQIYEDDVTWNNPFLVGAASISAGTWHHIAVARRGNSVRLFVDGTEKQSGTNTDTIFTGPTNNYNVFIGRDAFTGAYFDGYMAEVRVSKVARYTAGFTAPTEPFVNDNDTLLLLHGTGTNNSTLFQDDNGMTRAKVDVGSVNGAAIDTANYQWSGASGEFDGTNDYLELPFRHGNFSGDFTVECWMDTADTEGEIMACQKQGTNEGWTLITRSLGRLIWTSTTNGSSIGTLISSNSAWSDNTWVHIAVCHNNSTGLTELYANGARVGSQTEQNPITVTSGGYFRIGGNIFGISSGLYQDGPRYFDGHLDDVRISNSVRYSGASYTVPTGPFQNDSNTVLLLPFNGTDGSTDFTDDNGKEKN